MKDYKKPTITKEELQLQDIITESEALSFGSWNDEETTVDISGYFK